MKLTMILAAMLAISGMLLSAKDISPVGIDSLSYDRHGDFMVVNMDIDLTKVDVVSSRAQIITPMIVSAHGDTVTLPSLGVYGRSRYINYQRRHNAALSQGDEAVFQSHDRPATYDYMASVPYRQWMDNSRLLVRRSLYGCTNCLLDVREDEIAVNRRLPEPEIQMIDLTKIPVEEITGTLDGSAYIDFVVNKTDINPDYRRNPVELMKIKATIDTVVNDSDVTITGVWLKGFASPESPYDHNRDLAIGRTEALKEHLCQLYNFDPGIITTDYQAEDWAGLRKNVVASNIGHKAEILEIIDSDMEPDSKEALIKKRFPKEYRFMLDNFYPGLRHTEYRITYKVKHTDDVNKIREMMMTRPNRLTQREFYILANTYTPGSDEYFDVFETASRIYPDDKASALNAAYAALKRKDVVSAVKYLAKAGDSDEATYARGAVAYLTGDYDGAISLLETIPSNEIARNLLIDIKQIRAYQSSKKDKIILD